MVPRAYLTSASACSVSTTVCVRRRETQTFGSRGCVDVTFKIDRHVLQEIAALATVIAGVPDYVTVQFVNIAA